MKKDARRRRSAWAIAAGASALLAGCGAPGVRYEGRSALGSASTGGGYQGATVSIGSDSRLALGIIVAVMAAQGVRYYRRGPDGSMTPLRTAPDPDPQRLISE